MKHPREQTRDGRGHERGNLLRALSGKSATSRIAIQGSRLVFSLYAVALAAFSFQGSADLTASERSLLLKPSVPGLINACNESRPRTRDAVAGTNAGLRAFLYSTIRSASIRASATRGTSAALQESREQVHLGDLYLTGMEVAQDYKEAVRWYRMAGESGDPLAQRVLAELYAAGEAVPQNRLASLRWYRKAAEGGDAVAQCRVGIYIWATLNDPVRAHMWLNLSASQGNRTAEKHRDLVANALTRDEVAEAHELARAYQNTRRGEMEAQRPSDRMCCIH